MPFHLYSMRQAIEEGFILDVLANYTTYATYYRLANDRAGRPGGAGRARHGRARRFVSLHPTNLDAEGRDHRRALPRARRHRIGGRAKAMVVTRSRLHAVRTSRRSTPTSTSKGYAPGRTPLRALVAFSRHARRCARRGLHRGDDERVLGVAAAEEVRRATTTRCWWWRRSTRPGSTSRCCTRCTWTRSSPGSRRCRRCPGSTASTRARATRSSSTSPTPWRRSRTRSRRSTPDHRDPDRPEPALQPAAPHRGRAGHRPRRDAQAVTALLAGKALDQGAVYAALHPAVDRYEALPAGDPAAAVTHHQPGTGSGRRCPHTSPRMRSSRR